MLSNEQIQDAIMDAARSANLRKSEGDEPVDAVARNVASVLSHSTELPMLDEDTIRKAISATGTKLTFLSIIEAIRKQYRIDQKERQRCESEKRTKDNNEMAIWNFFIKCWHAFKKNGNVKTVSALSVEFLASWMKQNPRMIDEKELDTCREWMKKPEWNSTFDETVVIYVMNKLKKTEQANPQKVEEFIRKKKESVRAHYSSKYGCEPVWD